MTRIKCPICESAAELETKTTFDGDLVHCSICKPYGISRKVDLAKLTPLSLAERQRVLRKAQSRAKGELPKIATYDMPTLP